MILKNVLIVALIVVVAACKETHFKEDKVFAGGVYVSAATLNLGKTVYTEYCMACHGEKGDGNGVASKGLVPPPRNFTLGLFKFGKVYSGGLPLDQDMVEVIQKGLHGTAMLPWDISTEQALAAFHYIKTFAPEAWEGKDKKLGDKVVLAADPFGLAHQTSAIQRGKEVYHASAQCFTCHRAYVSTEELSGINLKINGEAITSFDSEMYKLKLQESDHNTKIIPPDFTWHTVRSAVTVEELAVRLAAGVGGTTMPSWKDTISDDDIWAVAYYVRSLMDLKNSADRKKIIFSE
jgi:mono/diheme cytochrome c family protein